MKKIIAVVIATMVAISAFALDISAMIQLDGNLATIKKDAYQAIELNAYDPSGSSDFLWKFDVSGDKAGATIFSYSGLDAQVSEWNIWLKPIDMLKITAGNFCYQSARPHFGWWASVINLTDYGFGFDITPIANLTINAALGAAYGETGSKGTYWWSKDRYGFRAIGDFALAASYNVDKIGLFGAGVYRGAQVNPHGFAQTQAWSATPLAVNLYYSNQPWGGTGYFADVALAFKEKGKEDDYMIELDRITGQLYFEFHLGALPLTVYAIDVLEYNFNSGEKIKAFKDGFELKVQYVIGAFTPYVQIDGYKIMDGSITPKVAVGFNVGACAIDAGVSCALDWSKDFSCEVTMPIQFTLNF